MLRKIKQIAENAIIKFTSLQDNSSPITKKNSKSTDYFKVFNFLSLKAFL